MRRLAGRCFAHRWLVLLGWVAGLAILTAVHSGAGSAYGDNARLPGTQSFDAVSLLAARRAKRLGRHGARRDRGR